MNSDLCGTYQTHINLPIYFGISWILIIWSLKFRSTIFLYTVKIILKISMYRDFSGGLVVKNSPSNAGELGSNPSGGTKIPHATGQLSLGTISTELACSRAHVPQLERPTEPACHSWSLCATTKEPAWCNKDPACCN